jgi:hypothetical protein
MITPHPVLQTMASFIESWKQYADRRAIFLTCYSMMTDNMIQALEAGEFEDQVWVEALVHRFADYYFEALHAYDTGVVAPASVWNYTFEAARTSELHVIQDLLLGVNAHICYDLVFVLVEQLPDWSTLTEAEQAIRYRDHCHVNEIIFRTTHQVQEEVVKPYDPMLGTVDVWMGAVDEWILHQLIVKWRDEVWQFATRLLCCATKQEIEAVQEMVEQRTLQRAAAIAGAQGLRGLSAIF